MKIREIENYGLKILNEKAKDGSMVVYAKFSEAEKRNQNSRIYPLEILSREVSRVQSKIASGQFLGQSDHSDSPGTFLKDVSHVVTGLEMKGNEGYATIKILNTDAGRNVQEIIKGKGKVGISTRSVGTIDAKTGIVQKDLRLLALDLVANPSVKDATIGKENILEGLDFEVKNEVENEEEEDREQVMYTLLSASYGTALTQGFQGDFDLYAQLHESGLRKVMHLPENKKTPTQKIVEAEEQVSERIYSFYQEAIQGGFIGSFDEWKEKFPQIIETAGEQRKIIEKKAPEPKEPFKSKATWEEIQLSGFRGTPAEYEEKYPNITIIKPESPRKPIVETLEQEAERIFEGLRKDNPNSSLTLESIKDMLKKEYESKREKKTRELAIYRVNRSMAGSGSIPSSAILEKMIVREIESIKEEKEEKKRKNWAAYKKLLSD